jgi:beta-1,4-mannosyl-glycoprotein beta-1,4-N-acetylglucosaminyltransferase
MIYDCFIFFDELDLLEIRLEELYPVVDKFVLCEAPTTFSGKPKELIFEGNKKRYEKYLNKIEHIICELPTNCTSWAREHAQRRAMGKALQALRPEDYVVISDCDEIPERTTIAKAIQTLRDNPEYVGPLTLTYQLYYGKLTHKVIEPEDHRRWRSAVVIPGPLFSGDCQEYKQNRGTYAYSDLGGWHFSYLGNAAQIIKKIESYAHTEFDTPEIKSRIQERLDKGEELLGRPGFVIEKVLLDDSYPIAIKNTPGKYAHLA